MSSCGCSRKRSPRGGFSLNGNGKCQCKVTKSGLPCNRMASKGSKFCWQHQESCMS